MLLSLTSLHWREKEKESRRRRSGPFARRKDLKGLKRQTKRVSARNEGVIQIISEFLLLAEIHRLQTIHAITQHISSLASTVTALDTVDPLEPFTADFTKLIEDFRAEYEEYDLDEVVVGAISQVVSAIRSPVYGWLR
jgi:tuftelin-interacting protein 11